MSDMRSLLFAVPALLLLTTAPRAHANCAAPTGYRATVSGRTVTVCLENFKDRKCPDQGLLRRSGGTGEAVVVTDCDASHCFVDECVPAGTWQYGLASPYECESASCGTYYFDEVTVSDPGGTCTRSPGRSEPATFSGTVPWGGDQLICDYGGGRPGFGCMGTNATVFTANGLALLLGGALRLRRRRAIR